MIIDTEKFTKDLKRMCGKDDSLCSECPLYGTDCNSLEDIDKIAPIVQKWAEEHPAKTYLMDMKEKFPDMIIDNDFTDFTMKYCVWRFYGNNAKPKEGCVTGYCEKCWNREMK